MHKFLFFIQEMVDNIWSIAVVFLMVQTLVYLECMPIELMRVISQNQVLKSILIFWIIKQCFFIITLAFLVDLRVLVKVLCVDIHFSQL